MRDAMTRAAVYTPEMLAERWQCSAKHVRNMISDGRLRAFRLGGKLLRITEDAVTEFECQTIACAHIEESSPSSGTKTDGVTDIRLARMIATQQSGR